MNAAYVDTSCLVALEFGEPVAADLAKSLQGFDGLFSSAVLEAELESARRREGREMGEPLVQFIHLLLPRRPLTEEIRRVLSAGYLRGCDCWHVACALYLAPDPRTLSFVTLDAAQKSVAAQIGFRV